MNTRETAPQKSSARLTRKQSTGTIAVNTGVQPYHPAPPLLALTVQQQQREMELLALQQEIRDKNTQLELVQAKYKQLETNFGAIMQHHRKLISHLDELKRQIEEERRKSFKLSHDIQLKEIEILKAKDMSAKIAELEKEVELLKELNKSLEGSIVQEKVVIETTEQQKYKVQLEQMLDEKTKLENALKTQFLEVRISREEIENLNRMMNEQKQAYEERIRRIQESIPKPPDTATKDTNTDTIRYDDSDAQTESVITFEATVMTDPLPEPEPPKKEAPKVHVQVTEEHQGDEVQVPPPAKKQFARRSAARNSTTIEPTIQKQKRTVRYLQDENFFEIKFGTLIINSQQFPYELLPVFLDLEFFEFDTVNTSTVTPSPENITASQTILDFGGFKCVFPGVRMDDFFIYYIKSRPNLTINLNVAQGMEYEHVATCNIPLNLLVRQQSSESAIEGYAKFISINTNVEVAKLKYSMRMEVPLAKAIENVEAELLDPQLRPKRPETSQTG